MFQFLQLWLIGLGIVLLVRDSEKEAKIEAVIFGLGFALVTTSYLFFSNA